MEENRKMNDEQLDQVSGGSITEYNEIADYINTHGGNVSYGDNMRLDVDLWLCQHCREIGLARTAFDPHESNVYYVWDESHENMVPATQAELMARLRTLYGE